MGFFGVQGLEFRLSFKELTEELLILFGGSSSNCSKWEKCI